MGKVLPSEKEDFSRKEAVHWEKSFPVRSKFSSKKGTSHKEESEQGAS